MLMKMSLQAAAMATAALLAATSAGATTVKAGETLVVDFHLPASSSPLALTYYTDTLFLVLDLGAADGSLAGTATLIDHFTVLGTASSMSEPDRTDVLAFYWTAAGSSFTHPTATAIDGTSLRDKSIDGQIRVQINRDYSFSSLELSGGHAVGSAIRTEGGTQPSVDNVAITAVPEPGTFGLMLLGVMGLAGITRRPR